MLAAGEGHVIIAAIMPSIRGGRSLIPLALCLVLFATVRAVQTQPGASSADARLRALYTEEWNWRQQELARGDQPGAAGADRFPRVDAAARVPDQVDGPPLRVKRFRLLGMCSKAQRP